MTKKYHWKLHVCKVVRQSVFLRNCGASFGHQSLFCLSRLGFFSRFVTGILSISSQTLEKILFFGPFYGKWVFKEANQVSYWNFSMSLFLRRPSFQLSPNQSVSAVRNQSLWAVRVKEKARSGVISFCGGWSCFTRAKIKRSKLLWTVNIARNLPNKFKGVLSLRMVKSCLFFIKEK